MVTSWESSLSRPNSVDLHLPTWTGAVAGGAIVAQANTSAGESSPEATIHQDRHEALAFQSAWHYVAGS
jgi:hypothetical protein